MVYRGGRYLTVVLGKRVSGENPPPSAVPVRVYLIFRFWARLGMCWFYDDVIFLKCSRSFPIFTYDYFGWNFFWNFDCIFRVTILQKGKSRHFRNRSEPLETFQKGFVLRLLLKFQSISTNFQRVTESRIFGISLIFAVLFRKIFGVRVRASKFLYDLNNIFCNI